MNTLVNFFLSLLLQYGYPIVVIVVGLGSLGLPIPVNSVLVAAGSLSFTGQFNLIHIVALATLTSITADLIIYALSQRVGIERVRKYLLKVGVNKRKLDAVDKVFDEYLGVGIFFSRWLITPFSLPMNVISGLKKYSLLRFIAYSIVGDVIWSGMYCLFGYFLSESWIWVLGYIRHGKYIMIAVFVIAFFMLVGVKLKRRQSRKKSKKKSNR